MSASDQNQDENFVLVQPSPMARIRYSLHFKILVLAALIFWPLRNLELGARTFNFEFFPFALMGFLHAACLVISLRDRKAARPIIALCFITFVTLWSAVTPILGLWGSIIWTPIADILPKGEFLILVTGSAIGSAGYWLLVRLFWLKSLRRAHCLRSVALCVTSTLLSSFVMQLLPNGFVILTIPWWFAFSLSLYWSERTSYARTPIPATIRTSQ